MDNSDIDGGAPASQESAFEDDEALELNLDMSQADTKVWLVKVPWFLAERWNRIEEGGQELGKIRINHNAPSSSRDNITLMLKDTTEFKDLPKEYRLTVRDKAVKNTYIFDEDEEGEAHAITGTVHHDCSIEVKDITDPRYRRLMQSRTYSQTIPMKRTQIMGEDARPMFIAPSSQNDPRESEFLQKRNKRPAENKATRMEHDDLIDMLFTAFEKYEYWNLKGIVKYTHQPQVYVKEVLGEICELVKKGTYHSMYRLKEEFRRRKSSNDGTMNPEAQDDDDLADEETTGTGGESVGRAGDESSDEDDEDEDDFEEVE